MLWYSIIYQASTKSHSQNSTKAWIQAKHSRTSVKRSMPFLQGCEMLARRTRLKMKQNTYRLLQFKIQVGVQPKKHVVHLKLEVHTHVCAYHYDSWKQTFFNIVLCYNLFYLFKQVENTFIYKKHPSISIKPPSTFSSHVSNFPPGYHRR